jgi:hypothetical protein
MCAKFMGRFPDLRGIQIKQRELLGREYKLVRGRSHGNIIHL